jgi:hypothetical protein
MWIVKYFIFLQVIHYTPQYIVGWGLLSTSYFYKLYIIHIQYWSVDGKYRIYLTRLRNGVKDELLAIHYTPQYIVGWGLLSTSYFYKLYIIHLNILLGGDC